MISSHFHFLKSTVELLGIGPLRSFFFFFPDKKILYYVYFGPIVHLFIFILLSERFPWLYILIFLLSLRFPVLIISMSFFLIVSCSCFMDAVSCLLFATGEGSWSCREWSFSFSRVPPNPLCLSAFVVRETTPKLSGFSRWFMISHNSVGWLVRLASNVSQLADWMALGVWARMAHPCSLESFIFL